MKKVFYMLIATAFALTACELERSDNGDLDGIWKMQGLDSLATGKFVDKSNGQTAYLVQKNLLQLEGAGSTILCRFEHKGDSLIIYDPRTSDFNNNPITDIAPLRNYGINSLRQSFHIDALSGSRMILKSDELRLYFEKY